MSLTSELTLNEGQVSALTDRYYQFVEHVEGELGRQIRRLFEEEGEEDLRTDTHAWKKKTPQLYNYPRSPPHQDQLELVYQMVLFLQGVGSMEGEELRNFFSFQHQEVIIEEDLEETINDSLVAGSYDSTVPPPAVLASSVPSTGSVNQ